jgi:hypothetical protein
MSYEGYEQHICVKGHRFDTPASFMFDDELKCHCGAASAWFNSVDDTNCDSNGCILDFSSFLIEGRKEETCKCCGHTKVIEEARYRVPNDTEANALRCYREQNDAGEQVWYRLLTGREISHGVHHE